MQAKIRTIYDNEYRLQLRDSITGEIKQDIKTHNVVLNRLWEIKSLTETDWTMPCANIRGISVGSGTGTPSASDSGLFNELWNLKGTKKVKYFGDEDTGVEITLVATFPANASYVGNITEVGIRVNAYESSYNSDYGNVTHALLQDAEGNPISMNKTDLDELVVTAIFRFTMEGVGFKLLPLWSSWLGAYFRDNSNASMLCQTFLTVQRAKKGYAGSNAGYVSQGDYSKETGITDLTLQPKPSYNPATHTFVFTNSRVQATAGNTHYYNSLLLNNFGYWTLPNPDIFPFYTIDGIEIGIGDGVRTVFDNPLNYFVQDTEVITVNGVQMTRNVDYTIDYHNNKDMLVEISEGHFAHNHSDLDVYNTTYHPFFQPCDHIKAQATDSGNRMGKEAPIYIDFEKDTTINTLRISGLYGDRESGTAYAVNSASFKLSYSNDGQDYVEILTTENFNAYNGSTFHFDNITAKYFKLEIIAEQYLSSNNFYYMHRDKIVYPACNECFIGYVGDPNITFANPPAADAVILMSVQMDRPFKNSNFVIDVTGDITIS